MWLHICTERNSTRQHVCGAVARKASLQHLHPCARGSSGVTRELWARVPVSQPYPRSHLESCPAAGVVLLILWELQAWVVRTLPTKEVLTIHQELQEFAKRSLGHDGSHFRGSRLSRSHVHRWTGVARGAGASGMGFWSMPIIHIRDWVRQIQDRIWFDLLTSHWLSRRQSKEGTWWSPGSCSFSIYTMQLRRSQTGAWETAGRWHRTGHCCWPEQAAECWWERRGAKGQASCKRKPAWTAAVCNTPHAPPPCWTSGLRFSEFSHAQDEVNRNY